MTNEVWTHSQYRAYLETGREPVKQSFKAPEVVQAQERPDFPVDRLVVDSRVGYDPARVLASMRQVIAEWHRQGRHHKAWNGLETSYAQRLEALRVSDELEAWGFELLQLRIGQGATLKIDWQVIRDGRLELHETKGFLWSQDSVRLRAYLGLYPWPLVMVRRKAGEWVIK